MRTWRSTYVTFGFALRPMLLPGARARGYERAFSDEWGEAPGPVREATRRAFRAWAEATGLEIVEAGPVTAMIRVAMSPVVKRWGVGLGPPRGYVFHHPKLAGRDWGEGGRLFAHGLHETGHALGLGHAGWRDPRESVMATGWPRRLAAYPSRPTPADVAVIRWGYAIRQR